ncbi:polysaccharide biosynthesis/export family protein [Nafulsella turpanensis]|uniref:polysaccharide biosynthesis/export family protein n=1 Tax=Nafulsella turpanensis TaxID=1265690 RepID=UPI00034560B8|nr:polysaccharide biosynthesis/export family protein [Nafulsella turpanensis]
MNQKIIIVLISILAMACVPTRKEVILQGEDGVEEDVAYNQPVRDFNAPEFSYELKPDDIISIKVSSTTPSQFDFFNQQSERGLGGFNPNDPLLAGFKIEEDGTIPLPVVGEVEVAGLTIEQARAKIQEIVAQYLDSPTVDVKLLSFQYTVLGEVVNQGRFTTYNPKLSILEAIGEAGGFSDFAKRSHVKVVRKVGDEISIAYVNVLDDDLLESPYYYLQPGDVVTVPPLPAKNWRSNNIANIGVLFSGISSLAILLNYVLSATR